MAIDGRKLVNYLAHGISPTQIATALGITPARVTQLASEERVITAVKERQEALAEEGVTEITDLKGIKKTLVEKMADLANYTESLSEAVNAFEKIDRITSTKLGRESEDTGVKQIIMQAPIFIQNQLPSEVILDSSRRIVSIKGRNMAQMPTQGVLKILQGKENDDDPETNDPPAEDSAPADLSGLRL